MPATTTCMSFPYPLDSDRIDVALDIKKLAQAVDAAVCGIQMPDLDARFVNRTGDTMTGMLTLPATNPTSDNHAVRKRWVDDNFVHVSGDTMTGHLTLPASTPTADNHAVRKKWVDDNFVHVAGDVMTGDLNMNGHTVVGLANPPPSSLAAVPLNYLNAQLQKYVLVNGDTVTGQLRVATSAGAASGVTLNTSGAASFESNVAGTTTMVIQRGASADAVGERFIRFDRTGGAGAIGWIDIGPDQTHVRYSTSSDYRLKESLGPIDDAAQRVQTLARRAFCGRWRGSGATADLLNAHDIAEVAPYAVSGDKDGDEMQMVSYGDLVPLLLSALGSALDRIDALEATA